MFSSLKLTKNLRQRNKQNQPANSNAGEAGGGPLHLDLTNNVTSKPPTPIITTNRRSHKWSLDKALCPGLSDKANNVQNRKLALVDDIEAYGNLDYNDNKNATIRADDWSHFGQDENVSYTCRLAHVCIERDASGSLGITLRGGLQSNPENSSPLIITQVRPNGPADREGTIKAGDRLLCVDGRPLHSVTLSEAQTILRSSGGPVSTLTIEYNVSNMDHLRNSHSALLVEVNTTKPHSLGLTLVSTRHNSLVVGHVKVGSIAERCGAFMPGDQILAVNGTRIEGTDMNASDVYNLLWNPKDAVLLIEVLAAPTNTLRGYVKNNWYTSSTPTLSSPTSSTVREQLPMINHCKLPSHDTVGGIVHTESMLVSLHANPDGNFGLMLQWSESQRSTVIACIEAGGPAERCGCLRVGDRVLSVNECTPPVCAEPRPLEQLFHGTSAILSVQFDIAQTVVPATGIFTVKLANNKNCGLGITITGCNHGMVISQIRAGSVAHRSGTLFPGDKILAVNNCSLDVLTLDEAIDVLQSATDIVTLMVKKETQRDSNVAYTVELVRNGGPLGITIAGSEDCCEPIVVSAITPGGLAERTGALQIGDQLLEIDGHTVEKHPLSKAITLLQQSGENVILKVSRLSQRLGLGYSSPGLPSVDSAVESWDSSQSPSVNHGSTPPYCKNDDNYNDNQTPPNASWQQSKAHQQSSNSLNTTTIQSDADTCSSYRLSESVLSELQAQLQASQKNGILPSPPCPLQVKYQHRNNTLPPARRRSSIIGLHDSLDCIDVASGDNRDSMFQFSDQETLTHQPDNQTIPEITFNTFLSKNQSFPSSRNNSDSSLCGKDVFQVTLYKDPIYEDFGFSVSDGLYERGVFINRIRQGGPADNSRMLKPYDRILQVNDTRTQDFDCCLTVPLVAAAGDRLTLVISRPKTSIKEQEDSLPWVEEEIEDTIITVPEIHNQTITKTL